MNDDIFGGLFVIFLVCVAFVFLVTAAIFVVPVLAVAGAGWLIYKHHRDDPTRIETSTHEHTTALYEKVLAQYQALEPETWDIQDHFVPLATKLYDLEVGGRSLEPPPAIANSLEGARYRDRLAKLGGVTVERAADVHRDLEAIFDYFRLPSASGTLTIPIRAALPDLNIAVERLATLFVKSDHFPEITTTINRNFDYADQVFPSDYKGDDVVETYLRGTPLEEFFDIEVPFGIPKEKYFQHGLITAGTGAGKSQLVQWFVAQEYERLKAGEISVVVMDSQKELIQALLSLDLPLNRICYLNPSDIEFPVPISLFDLGMQRQSQYSAADQERVVNKAIEVLTFVIDSVLGADMTTKQGTLFNYLIRLLIQIPDATLHTMREILQPGGHIKYQEYIQQLSDTAIVFFNEQYDNKTEYGQTRQQVTRRLFDLLEVGVFDRMFSHPESKFDLFEEMNHGRLILLDTEKSLLQDSGTEVLGRLYLAMLNSAVQERALISDRKPVYFFCDEARDYVRTNSDDTISAMLEQARKMNVGTFWVTQHLGQIDMKMRSSFMANTAIKMISQPSHEDATRFAREMNTKPDFIKDLPALTFATFIKGVTGTAVPLRIPYGSLAELPQRDNHKELQQEMRDRYAVDMSDNYAEPIDEPEETLEDEPEDEGLRRFMGDRDDDDRGDDDGDDDERGSTNSL